ncbi:MAG: DUF4124 domain-containing protein [Deltaproteobacteria bacterium]|nr:DUF4124 domain-containing protein [Deltaproteobacteria bacterium]
MHRKIVFSFTALFFLFGSTIFADTIYTWTDAGGVKRYSNSQPPEDAENVQTIQEIPYNQRSDDQQRREYDRMVEDASKGADRHFEEQADKKAQEEEARQQQQLEAQARRIEQERAKLQKEIDDIQGRGLSRTFSPGQKEYLIRQIQEKIDQLENNPDDYFTK